jgi:rsbT antagonist protein RsbS
MNDASQIPRVTINLMRNCLVATIQFDLTRAILEQFRKDLLARLAGANAREIILDCSGVEVMDAEDFDALRRTAAMASLMGARTVIAGLQPGVVSALVSMDVDLDGLHTALNLDDAFRLLEGGEPDMAASQSRAAESANNDAPPQ